MGLSNGPERALRGRSVYAAAGWPMTDQSDRRQDTRSFDFRSLARTHDGSFEPQSSSVGVILVEMFGDGFRHNGRDEDVCGYERQFGSVSRNTASISR